MEGILSLNTCIFSYFKIFLKFHALYMCVCVHARAHVHMCMCACIQGKMRKEEKKEEKKVCVGQWVCI